MDHVEVSVECKPIGVSPSAMSDISQSKEVGKQEKGDRSRQSDRNKTPTNVELMEIPKGAKPSKDVQ